VSRPARPEWPPKDSKFLKEREELVRAFLEDDDAAFARATRVLNVAVGGLKDRSEWKSNAEKQREYYRINKERINQRVKARSIRRRAAGMLIK